MIKGSGSKHNKGGMMARSETERALATTIAKLVAENKELREKLEMLVETHDNLVKEAKSQEPDENEIAMKHALFLIAVGNIRKELDREAI